MSVATRLRVPSDNSCLFSAVAALCETTAEARVASAATQRELREVAARAVLDDPDAATRALLLGKPVDEYAEWIRSEWNWGGENEILILATHYSCKLCVVSADATPLTYGAGGRTGYLLYTGTHYDALVGEESSATTTTTTRRLFEGGAGAEFEAACTAIAVQQRDAKARRDASERIFKIRCGGCGAKLADSAAFQRHCSEVEHDDDFAYDCAEIFEVEYDEDDPH